MSAFSISKPSSPLPIVYDSPHSGRNYPIDFRYACDFQILQTAEDQYVDELFAHVTEHGGAFLCAHFPRSYIDVNRSEDDIDPELLDAPWNGEFEAAPTARSYAGIGLVRRLVRPGIPVYDRALSTAEIMHRITRYYRPYHDAMRALIDEAHYNYGQAWHINCHSMPSASAYPKRGIGLAGNRAKAVDFVLGDRDGTSCDPAFTIALRDFIRSLGYSVAINDPFKGVECVERYSDPASGYHSIQIEINKALYMDEVRGVKTRNYARLQDDLIKLCAFIASFIENRLVNLAAD